MIFLEGKERKDYPGMPASSLCAILIWLVISLFKSHLVKASMQTGKMRIITKKMITTRVISDLCHGQKAVLGLSR